MGLLLQAAGIKKRPPGGGPGGRRQKVGRERPVGPDAVAGASKATSQVVSDASDVQYVATRGKKGREDFRGIGERLTDWIPEPWPTGMTGLLC